MRLGGACGDGFLRDVNHFHAARFDRNAISFAMAHSVPFRTYPGAAARSSIRPLQISALFRRNHKKTIAFTSAATSPEPCQDNSSTIGSPAPNVPARAGNASACAFCSTGLASLAFNNGNGLGSKPPQTSIAGTASNSKVTIVETGFPGRPKTNFPPHLPNTAGFPGRIAMASKKNSAPRSRNTASTKSYFPDGDSSAQDQNIFLQAAFDHGPQRGLIVRCVAERHRLRARQVCLRGERDAVAIANLNRSGRLLDWDHFVTGGKNRDTRLAVDFQLCGAHLRSHGQFRKAEPRAKRHHNRARFGFASGCTIFWPALSSRSTVTSSAPGRVCSCITTASAPAGTAAPVII